MKIGHSFLITLTLLLVVGNIRSLNAQNSNQLYFENFTVDNGLPGNAIRAITQDSLGYIWIATEGGVAKFDGYEFEIFRNIPGDHTSISDDDVKTILTDIHGTVWVDNFIGLDRYDAASNSFMRYFQDPASIDYIEPGNKSAIIATSSGSLLIVTNRNGLISYDPVRNIYKNYKSDPDDPESISSNHIIDLHEDTNGIIWFTTRNTGLNKFDPNTEIFTNITFEEDDPEQISSERISRKVFVDSDQILWVVDLSTEELQLESINKGGKSGIWQMDLKTGEYQNILYHPAEQPITAPISSIIESDNKSIWFAKVGPEKYQPGLFEFSKLDSSYTRHHYRPNDESSLLANSILVVYEDRNGGLWVGTDMGLSMADVSRKQFRSIIPLPDDLKAPENNFSDIIYIGDDIYWIERLELPLLEWNGETGEWETLDLQFKNSESYWGFGNRGRWLVSNNTLWIIEPPSDLVAYNITSKEKRTYSNKSTEESDYVFMSLTSDSNNNLWLGTSKGISKFSIDKKEFSDYYLRSVYSPDDSLAVISLIAGRDGNIWTMTIDVALDSTKGKQGIYLSSFDPINETFSQPVMDENYLSTLAHGYAREIMEDSNGDIWIAKSNGVVHYNRSEEYFIWYDQNDGLSGLFVNFITEDEFGKIWIATSYGLSRFDPENKVFRNFERSDGIIPLRMFSLKNIKGSIFLLGVGGMNVIDPSEIEEVSTPPKVLITGIKQNGKNFKTNIPVEYLEKIEIPWSESGLEIEYTAISFNAAQKTTYAYMLEGLNEEFQESSMRRYAQFTNLKPGEYTFRVNAMNAGGFRSQNDTVLVIRILPPWWRTWWAYGFYLILFFAGILVVDRYQRKRLLQIEREEAREKELEQAKEIEKAYHNLEIAHENLKSAQEQLIQQEKLASLGQLTAGIAHEIKNPLNFVNNFSDVSIEMIEEALEEVKKVNSEFNIKNSELSEILTNIQANLNKIHEHGTRADGIVKSMLMHSRGGSGRMHSIDLNALIKEYANLSFHGMRAGKNPISVEMVFKLDETIGEVPLIAEDFSRVILNLVNNAFDAMREKINSESKIQNSKFSPKLTVRTHQTEGTVTIEIEDNGPGIPDDIKDKILQPFFTTKKGTQGTGLGLSITHDIIKTHGGSMDIQSQPGKTTFKITLTI